MALAIAKRVGGVQAVSGMVSFVRHNASLSSVPEFVTKTVFFSNSLPRSFLVASWSDFAAGMDNELLLCLSVPSVFLLGACAARLEVGSVGAHRVWGVSTSAAFHMP